MPVTTGHVGIANARRANEVNRLKRQIDHTEGAIRRGATTPSGFPNPYAAEQVRALQEQRDTLQAEISRLNALSDEELVAELVPEVARQKQLEDNPPPSFRDSLDRGAVLSQPVEVHRNPPPVRHVGPRGDGVPWEMQGQQIGPPGWKQGEVYSYPKDEANAA